MIPNTTSIISTAEKALPDTIQAAADGLAHLLDTQGAGYPLIKIIDRNGELLHWEYSRHRFVLFEGARRIKLPATLSERGFTRLEAASIGDALELVSRVESLRQGTFSPYIHIAVP